MKKFVLLTLAVIMMGTLTGCETVKGIGKDFQNLGEGLKNLGD